MLARSMTVMEATLEDLDPNTNMLQIAANHKATMRQFHLKHDFKQWMRDNVRAYEKTLHIPGQTSDVLKMLERGQLKMNLNLLGSNQPIAKLDRMVNRLIVCILISALLLGSSLLCMTNMKPEILGIPALGFFGFVVAILMSFWLFVKMLVLHRRNKMF